MIPWVILILMTVQSQELYERDPRPIAPDVCGREPVI